MRFPRQPKQAPSEVVIKYLDISALMLPIRKEEKIVQKRRLFYRN